MPTPEEIDLGFAPGSLVDPANYDVFERAAARTRFGAKPLGGRQEGTATTLPQEVLYAPVRAAAGFTKAAIDRAAEEHGGATELSTDYDPRRAAADLSAETATNIVGTPALTGGAPIGSIGSGASRLTGPRVAAPAIEAAPIMQRSAEWRTGEVPFQRPHQIEQYVTDPQRVFAPGVYKDPRVIAREASEQVAPEHPALKELFGVTRNDLWEIGGRGTRKGNIEPQLWTPDPRRSKGSYAAEAIMNPSNAQRLIDTLVEAGKYPQLARGMDAWYVMDPMYQRMVQLVGPERAKIEYMKFNAIVPPFSAGSNVMTEINRGTAANMFATRGEYDRFHRAMGIAEKDRPRNFPKDLRDVKGHAYHGIQSDPVRRWLETGEHGYAKDTVKIPLYAQASGVPETGFQTRLPVPDAHFTRAAGMSDVRRNASPGDYMGGTEYRQFGPWFRENVARPVGIEAVPAQARMWGAYSPQTGVETPIGAPKLELLAQSIWERAQRLGLDPKKLRDDVLMGKEHALWLLGIPAAGGAMGELARQDQYQ
jgi:hypothetical protein